MKRRMDASLRLELVAITGLIIAGPYTQARAAEQLRNDDATQEFYQRFGYDGQNGQSGASGRNGGNGRAAVVTATGGSQSVQTQGGHGEHGNPGQQGGDAQGCHQPYNQPTDLEGASGGDAGDGGNGGNGGNGGDVTVYFTDPAHLARIQVSAGGGNPGSGAWGGRGGDGCDCTQHSWQVNGQTYTCQSGRDGRDGNTGRQGLTGAPGTAWLVAGAEPLPPVTPERAVTVGGLLETPALISQTLWTQRTGARARFAPGSTLADRYQEFDRVQRSAVSLMWSAERDPADFDGIAGKAYFNGRAPALTLAEDAAWFITAGAPDGDDLEVEVRDAILVAEVRDLALAGISGSGAGLRLTLTDKGGDSPNLTTTWHLHYHTRGLLMWKLRYDRDLPAALVHRQGETVTIDLGALPIDSDFLAAGERIWIELTATRRFGGHTKALAFEKTHTIQ